VCPLVWESGTLRSQHRIFRKDDYAFFLHPVDVASIPGYSDIVKRPMDLGTMTDKVHRGKYRSLEDFAVSVGVTHIGAH